MRGRARLLQLLLSVVILVWIYSKVPIGHVFAALEAADPRWVSGGAAFVLLLQVLASLRWGRLVWGQAIRLPLLSLVAVHFASIFYKLFIPGGMLATIGVRYVKLHRRGADGAAALSSVVVDRMLATLGLGGVGVTAWLFDEPPAPAAVGAGIAVWFVISAALLVAATHARTARTARALAQGGRLGALTVRLVRLADAFAMYRGIGGRHVVALVVLTVLPHVAGVLAYWALARAVGVEVDVLAWAWLRAAVTLVVTQPISIAGLGVRDVTITWLLAFFGVGEEHALAVSFLVLGVAVLMPAALGGLLEARALLPSARRR